MANRHIQHHVKTFLYSVFISKVRTPVNENCKRYSLSDIFSFYIRPNFLRLRKSAKRQKSTNRQAQHKPNVKLPRHYSYQISETSAHNCKRSSLLKKS